MATDKNSSASIENAEPESKSGLVFRVFEDDKTSQISIGYRDGVKWKWIGGGPGAGWPKGAKLLIQYTATPADMRELREAVVVSMGGPAAGRFPRWDATGSLVFEVHLSRETDKHQLSFRCGNSGYRLAGPNFNLGKSSLLMEHKLGAAELSQLATAVGPLTGGGEAPAKHDDSKTAAISRPARISLRAGGRGGTERGVGER